jgi:hypothetical protein
MMGCNNCIKMAGWSLLVLGVLFLLQDLNIWNFWNISWYTALFVVAGIGHLGSANCKNCQAMRMGMAGKKK